MNSTYNDYAYTYVMLRPRTLSYIYEWKASQALPCRRKILSIPWDSSMEIESWSDVQEQMVTGKYLTAILRKYNKLLHYEEHDQSKISCVVHIFICRTWRSKNCWCWNGWFLHLFTDKVICSWNILVILITYISSIAFIGPDECDTNNLYHKKSHILVHIFYVFEQVNLMMDH